MSLLRRRDSVWVLPVGIVMALAAPVAGTVAEPFGVAEPAVIDLPSGKHFDARIFGGNAPTLPNVGTRPMVNTNAFYIQYPSGKPFAVLEHRGDKLHGNCHAFHENNAVMLVGRYSEGERTGNLHIAADDGCPMLDAQYHNGDKIGFLGFYQQGVLVLLQEYDRGRLTWSHRVRTSAAVESIDHAGRPESGSKSIFALIDKCDDYEKKLKANERDIKKLVKELEDDIRRQRAAARGAMSQQMIQARVNARAAANDLFIGAMRMLANP